MQISFYKFFKFNVKQKIFYENRKKIQHIDFF